MKTLMRWTMAGLLLVGGALSVHAAVDHTSDTDMQILKDKIKADKKLVVAANMDLSDQEAKSFWPVYDSYQQDLDQINRRLGSTIMEYAHALDRGPLTDSMARKLMNEALAVEEDEVRLKQAYANELYRLLPPAKVARYIQLENKIRSMVRMELARNIPLAY